MSCNVFLEYTVSGWALSSLCYGNITIYLWGGRVTRLKPECCCITFYPNRVSASSLPPTASLLSPPHPHLQVRVGQYQTDIQLVKLLPNTAYGISVLALHGESASKPLSDQGVTRMWLTNKCGFLWGCLTFSGLTDTNLPAIQCRYRLPASSGFVTSPTAPWILTGMLLPGLWRNISSPTNRRMARPKK